MKRQEGYAPGWSDDAVGMVGGRSAYERATFVLPFLPGISRTVDVGCGPGTITVGLAQAVGPSATVLGVDRELSQVEMAAKAARAAGVTNTRFEQSSVYQLPVADHSVDLVFSHALFEHLADPVRALAEIRRVLRSDGLIALASSDWSTARLDPWNDDVHQALQGHYLLRRRAGGDPFMGHRLPDLVRSAGFNHVQVQRNDRTDMAYDQLARYVGTRVEAAIREDPRDNVDQLQKAATGARRWATRRGNFTA